MRSKLIFKKLNRGLPLSLSVLFCVREYMKAALVILRKGLDLSFNQAVGLDRPELKPLERETAARILGSNPYICVSFPQRRRKLTFFKKKVGGDHMEKTDAQTVHY